MTVARLAPFTNTIFGEMTALADAHGAINLGQGFPDIDGPARMLEIAREQIASGKNQYAPGWGVPELREAVATDRGVRMEDVLVTVGATEGIAATILGLVEPGSEVIVLEPYYDAYAAAIALAGARRVAVPLRAVEDSWDVDVAAIRAAVTDKTAMIIVNSPHNPTGAVFSRPALVELAQLVSECDLLVLSDEVYENLTFGDTIHTRIANLPGMAERTITVSSAAKSFNCTGWKTGWVVAEPGLLDGVAKAKQFMTFVGATPFQPAVAHALQHETSWLRDMVGKLEAKRDYLADALAAAGFHVHDTRGTYYLVADIAPLGYADGLQFCLDLPAQVGVAAIPVQAFCDELNPWKTKVRFAFCKNDRVLEEAGNRLSKIRKV